MLIERNGFLDFEYDGKLLHIKYYYWELSGAAYFNVYDRYNNEYRYTNSSMHGKDWILLRGAPKWALEFTKVLKDHLSQEHKAIQERRRD